jgi:YD repeat-containing protein
MHSVPDNYININNMSALFRNLGRISILFFLFFACSKQDETGNITTDQESPAAVNVCCASTPDNIIQRTEYQMNGRNLVSETTWSGNAIDSKTSYEYDTDNRLVTETWESYSIKMIKTYTYNYRNQLINIGYRTISFNQNGEETSENYVDAPLEYVNNFLVKKRENWGGFSTYTYQRGMLDTQTDYTATGEKHHITYFKYSGNLKTEERKETVLGTEIYTHTFYYDSRGRLLKVKEGNNVIEEYTYSGDRLLTKKIWYFGIDPGYYMCSGNLVYKYEYK